MGSGNNMERGRNRGGNYDNRLIDSYGEERHVARERDEECRD